MSIKQVIVMRKDLNMRKGKMVSQGAHSSLKVFFDMNMTKTIKDGSTVYNIHLPDGSIGEDITSWIEGIFTKITCSVSSEEDLLNVYRKAFERGLPCALVQDVGKTEFKGVLTYTCCAIGPAKAEIIDIITGTLPLL
jgi:PTH2 family peptidyl-tRNA hydrolase